MAIKSQTQRALLLTFIASIAGCGLVGIYCLIQGDLGRGEWKILASTALFGAAAMLALASAICGERVRPRLVGIIGIGAAIPALIFVLIILWLDYPFWQDCRWLQQATEKGAGIAWTLAVAFPLGGLLHMAKLHRGFGWVRRWTLVALVLLVGEILWVILFEPGFPSEDLLMRTIGVLSIAVVCGTIAVPILHRVSAIRARESVRTTELSISLTCPRCATTQTLGVGRSQCGTCRLRFVIDIEEEQCRSCGYPLYRLQSDRCPECGTPIALQPNPS